jgi:hypothetical protein
VYGTAVWSKQHEIVIEVVDDFLPLSLGSVFFSGNFINSRI